MVLLSAITWIPKYVLNVPPVIDPFDAIKQRKDLNYLDLPPDLVQQYQPKAEIKPSPKSRTAGRQKDARSDEQAPAPPPPLPTAQVESRNPQQAPSAHPAQPAVAIAA